MINQTKKARAPGNGDGPSSSGHHTAATRASNTQIPAATKLQSHSESSRQRNQAVAYALLLLALPGAIYDRALVRSCPICHYGHIHNLLPGEARTATVTRHPRCAPHRSYSLEITSVIPAAAVAGQRRRRVAS